MTDEKFDDIKSGIAGLQIAKDVLSQENEKLRISNAALTQKVKRLEEANELLKELEDVKNSLIKHQRLLLRFPK